MVFVNRIGGPGMLDLDFKLQLAEPARSQRPWVSSNVWQPRSRHPFSSLRVKDLLICLIHSARMRANMP
jgi:hypothetical protein